MRHGTDSSGLICVKNPPLRVGGPFHQVAIPAFADRHANIGNVLRQLVQQFACVPLAEDGDSRSDMDQRGCRGSLSESAGGNQRLPQIERSDQVCGVEKLNGRRHVVGCYWLLLGSKGRTPGAGREN